MPMLILQSFIVHELALGFELFNMFSQQVYHLTGNISCVTLHVKKFKNVKKIKLSTS